jgi:PBSX family phage terminase large subunit
MPTSQRTKLVKTYRPYGSQKELFWTTAKRVVYSGPVRCGKSTAIMEKCQYLCLKVPWTRILWLRQTKESMAQTVLQTFEQYVLAESQVVNYDKSSSRAHRQSYKFKNDSEIVIGGLSNIESYMSGEYDMVVVFQAEECLKNDIDVLMTRMSNYKLPFQQMILDVNPKQYSHWINQMCLNSRGQIPMIQASLKDNPRFWDEKKQDWTLQGKDYLDTLGNLTGHEYQRKVLGKWSNPEGARFETASRQVQGFNIYERWPQGIPSWQKKWLSVDYGVTSPYCALWHTVDENGIYYTYREDYQTGFQAGEQAERILALSKENEAYDVLMLDHSMFGKFVGYHPEKGEAAKQYQNVLERDPRFGPLKEGRKNEKEEGFILLDHMLRNGTWKIEIGCVNLWNELEGAIYYVDPRTNIPSELVNPNQVKKACRDDALDAAVYGLWWGEKIVSVEPESTLFDPLKARQLQHEEYLRMAQNDRYSGDWIDA